MLYREILKIENAFLNQENIVKTVGWKWMKLLLQVEIQVLLCKWLLSHTFISHFPFYPVAIFLLECTNSEGLVLAFPYKLTSSL